MPFVMVEGASAGTDAGRLLKVPSLPEATSNTDSHALGGPCARSWSPVAAADGAYESSFLQHELDKSVPHIAVDISLLAMYLTDKVPPSWRCILMAAAEASRLSQRHTIRGSNDGASLPVSRRLEDVKSRRQCQRCKDTHFLI